MHLNFLSEKSERIKRLTDLDKLISSLNILDIEKLMDQIKKIPRDSLKFNLSSWGINITEIEQIADLSFTKGRVENNIITIRRSDIIDILNFVY